MRTVILSAALLLATPAFACDMHDQPADYTAAVEKVEATDGTKVTLQLDGLHCESCSGKVSAALSAIDGVKAVAADYGTSQARVAFDASKVKVEALVAAITKLGFKATVAKS